MHNEMKWVGIIIISNQELSTYAWNMTLNLTGFKWKTSNSDYFTPGSLVSVKTCFDQKDPNPSPPTVGEVLTFDCNSKILIMRTASSSGSQSLSDVFMFNLNYVSEVLVLQDNHTVLPPLPKTLSMEKLDSRLAKNVEEKRRYIRAMQAGVSKEGQLLFLALNKTLRINDVSWDGTNIMIYNNIVISHPYKSENVKDCGNHVIGKNESDACIHIRKMVEKFYKDQSSVKKETTSPSVSPRNGTVDNINTAAKPLPQ